MRQETVRSLFDLATDPNQYTSGEATSWMIDEERQSKQQQLIWAAAKPYLDSGFHSVLDIGCGSAWTAKKLLELGIEDYVGLEPAHKNFTIAKSEHPELTILPQSLEEYAPDRQFDCALAIMVFCHLGDVEASLRKIAALLNPGGICLAVISQFHPGKERYERNGRRYTVQVIDQEQYTDMSIDGTGFGIADIQRTAAHYIRLALANGFSDALQTEFTDLGYSVKKLLVFQK